MEIYIRIKRFILLSIAIITILINPCVIKKHLLSLAEVNSTYKLHQISNKYNKCQTTQVTCITQNSVKQYENKINHNRILFSNNVLKGKNRYLGNYQHQIHNNSPPKYILYQSLKIHSYKYLNDITLIS